jgi:hypothetical protein
MTSPVPPVPVHPPADEGSAPTLTVAQPQSECNAIASSGGAGFHFQRVSADGNAAHAQHVTERESGPLESLDALARLNTPNRPGRARQSNSGGDGERDAGPARQPECPDAAGSLLRRAGGSAWLALRAGASAFGYAGALASAFGHCGQWRCNS